MFTKKKLRTVINSDAQNILHGEPNMCMYKCQLYQNIKDQLNFQHVAVPINLFFIQKSMRADNCILGFAQIVTPWCILMTKQCLVLLSIMILLFPCGHLCILHSHT